MASSMQYGDVYYKYLDKEQRFAFELPFSNQKMCKKPIYWTSGNNFFAAIC